MEDLGRKLLFIAIFWLIIYIAHRLIKASSLKKEVEEKRIQEFRAFEEKEKEFKRKKKEMSEYIDYKKYLDTLDEKQIVLEIRKNLRKINTWEKLEKDIQKHDSAHLNTEKFKIKTFFDRSGDYFCIQLIRKKDTYVLKEWSFEW